MADGWLQGKRVAVTGRLLSMTHAGFAQLVAERGGEFVPLPNRRTSLLVIGQDGWPLEPNGRQTKSLRMALLILNYGHNNEIYGSMVTYLRIKGMVPPASEPRGPRK